MMTNGDINKITTNDHGWQQTANRWRTMTPMDGDYDYDIQLTTTVMDDGHQLQWTMDGSGW